MIWPDLLLAEALMWDMDMNECFRRMLEYTVCLTLLFVYQTICMAMKGIVIIFYVYFITKSILHTVSKDMSCSKYIIKFWIAVDNRKFC